MVNLCRTDEPFKANGCAIGVFLVMFLAVGMGCWFSGCDATFMPYCINYNIEDTMIAGYYIPLRTCSYCSSSHDVCNDDGGCDTVCDAYSYYDCYDGFAKAQYPLITGVNTITQESYEMVDPVSNKTCLLQAANDELLASDALTTTEAKYPLGERLTMYISKSDGKCYEGAEVRSLAIVGFVFLLLAGLVVFWNAWLLYAEQVEFKELEEARKELELSNVVDDSGNGAYAQPIQPQGVYGQQPMQPQPMYQQPIQPQPMYQQQYAQTPVYGNVPQHETQLATAPPPPPAYGE